jgi:hypothetical protein
MRVRLARPASTKAKAKKVKDTSERQIRPLRRASEPATTGTEPKYDGGLLVGVTLGLS